jgi:HTH-type transcriptional regulator/antitoxin HipB
MQQIARSSPQIGAAFRRRRKQLKLSQEQVAAQAKLRQATISNLESGGSGTKLETVFDVLAALDLELIVRPRTKGRVADIENLF